MDSAYLPIKKSAQLQFDLTTDDVDIRCQELQENVKVNWLYHICHYFFANPILYAYLIAKYT